MQYVKYNIVVKVIILIICSFIFVACDNNSDSNQNLLSLSFDEKEDYKEKIYNLMYEYYWKYDDTTFEFFSSNIPSDIKENESIFQASNDIGLNLLKYSGQNCIVVTVNLQHFNGNSAGRGYYYFINDKIVGAYYTSGNAKNVYSFNIRNIFLNSPSFIKYETNENQSYFKEYKSALNIDGFSDTSLNDKGVFMALSINENILNIYTYSNNKLIIYKTLNLSKYDSMPISATFIEENGILNGLAVIIGKKVETYEQDVENISFDSEKVIFFDKNFNKINSEILLENNNATYIFTDDNNIGIFLDENIEYYSNINSTWTKINQFRIEHTINHIHITDLDNDNIKEYIMTDGFDMYMYRKTDNNFINIWRTHIMIPNFIGYIYSGDLNNDGVKEIYVSDITGTVIRYILTEKGLLTNNEDIEYGENIYTSDFNNDGKDDYIKVFFDEKLRQSMFIQQ